MADQQASSSSTAAPAGAATESTPLLRATSADGASTAPAPPPQEDTGRTGADRATYALITASVFLGPITIILGCAMLVAIVAIPGGYRFSMSYRLQEAWFGVGAIAVVTTIFSSVNFARHRRSLRPLPLVFNTVIDGVAGVYLSSLAWQPISRGSLDAGYCYSNGEGKEQCERFRRGFGVLVLVFLLGGICLGLCHLILFVLRLVKAFRSRSGQNGRLSIPAGQLTFEFTIKLLRQEPAVREPVASASATTARGTDRETV